MDHTRIQRILEDATKLAEKAIPAFEAQSKLAKIQPEFESLKKASNEVENQKLAEQAAFRANANRLADILVTRGILEDSNKVAFVEEITTKPEELFGVTIKLAGELKAESFGSPSELPSSAELDPFERLAVS